MKTFAFIAVVLCIIQLTYADGETTASPPKKTCTDLLDQATCDSLQKLVDRLKEAKSTIQDAIDAAVKAHVQTKEEIKKYVKDFIAQRIQCEKILSIDMCTVLNAVATRLKLTKEQVQQAIETAVSTGKKTAQQVYQEVLKVLQGDIDCDRILGTKACNNLGSALDKFHEQRQLIKEAIMDAALKHYKNTKDLLNFVQEELTKRITNFQCSSVLPADLCTKITEIATHLKISSDKVKEAIELAVMNGLTTANAIYTFTLEFLTDLISCEKILSQTACANFVEATKKFKEQTKLIKQAIMDAVQQKITDVKGITKYVAKKIIDMAVNFQCTDVLPQKQCDLLTKIAGRFHIRTKELIRVLKEAIVNGKNSVQAIYDATIKALVEEAKSLTCEEMIDPTVCAVLDNFASKLRETKDDVTDAVRKAIAQGLTTAQDIRAYVKNLLVDEKSCYDFFRSRIICKSIQLAAWVKGVTFDRVINKIRELYASGVTTITAIRQKLKEIFGISDSRRRRSMGILATKDEVVDLAMQIVGGIMKFSQKVTENIRADIRKLVDSGKLRLTNMYSKIKELIQKYNPLSDEFEDEVPSDMKDLSQTYRAARKALSVAIQRIVLVAKRFGIKSEELMKMVQDMYKGGVKDINDAMLSGF